MNTTKWEAVAYGDLKRGDKVRVKHDSGDVFHGTVRPSFADDMSIDLDNLLLPALSRDSVVARGYSFERAVPERALPTEPGLYALVPGALTSSRVMRLRRGEWEKFGPINDADAIPLDDVLDHIAEFGATRLVPVTEVEELRKRIALADEYLAAQHRETEIGDVRPTLIAALYGEASNV